MSIRLSIHGLLLVAVLVAGGITTAKAGSSVMIQEPGSAPQLIAPRGCPGQEIAEGY